MLLWGDDTLAALDRGLLQARAGHPTLVVIEGESGTGKTSLLTELLRRAGEFHLLPAEGAESVDAPAAYSVLAQWGVAPAHSVQTGDSPPFLVAQQLREVLDGLPPGPVLLLLDDAQWADPESVEAIRWLLARAEGDPLLIAVGTRPVAGPLARALARLGDSTARPIRLSLTGLNSAQASSLIRARRPGLTEAAAHRLWEHTGGSPLYLTALLDEFDTEVLARAHGLLPAPAEFAAIIEQRLSRLDRSARVVLEALGVLGGGWSTATDVAAVARSTAVTSAVDELVAADLAQVRTTPFLSLRPQHALVRAAVYHQTPFELRRVLHRRAAEIVDAPASLDHRLAAADRYDTALAADLESWATGLHRRRLYRQAAHYHEAAGVVSADRTDRDRRRGEALWDLALAGEAAPGPTTETASSADRPRFQVVVAFTLLRAGDARSALRALDDLHGPELRRADPLVQYRIGVLSAYLRMLLGASAEQVCEALDRVDGLGVADTALARIESPTRGYMAARRYGAGVLDFLFELPDDAIDFTPAQRPYLIWRGLYRVSSLQIRGAVADFEAMIENTGRSGDTVAHQLHLGQARWFAGDWPLAKVAFDVGIDASFGASTWLPEFDSTLLPSAQGRFDEADPPLDAAVERCRALPWPENRLLLLIVLVVRCHAEGAPPDQIARLAAPFEDLDTLVDFAAPLDTLMLVHAGLAALWLDRPHAFDVCLDKLRTGGRVGQSHWIALTWLEGLDAARRGGLVDAERLLRLAAEDPANELPLYRAHMWSDHAEVAARLGDRSTTSSRQAALELYRRLGAAPYVTRLEAARDGTATGAPSPTSYRPDLTPRERDVLALLVTGLSYAQIAGSMFVTRSTVSFHLSKLYAKFAVSTRHELTALVRQQPDLLTMLTSVG